MDTTTSRVLRLISYCLVLALMLLIVTPQLALQADCQLHRRQPCMAIPMTTTQMMKIRATAPKAASCYTRSPAPGPSCNGKVAWVSGTKWKVGAARRRTGRLRGP